MSQQPLPYGAREIVETRTIGKRPADMVLVSLVGPLRELNPVVVAKPERCYDWRFLVDLEVLIVVSSAIDKALVARCVKAILAQKPQYLGLWFADRQQGLNIAFGLWKLRSGRGMGAAYRAAFAGIGALKCR